MGLHVAGIVSRRNDWCDSVASALRFGVNNQKVMKRLIFFIVFASYMSMLIPSRWKELYSTHR